MGKVNHNDYGRTRQLCKDIRCGAEIETGRIYCRGHEYLIARWLERSRQNLERYKRLAGENESKDPLTKKDIGDRLS